MRKEDMDEKTKKMFEHLFKVLSRMTEGTAEYDPSQDWHSNEPEGMWKMLIKFGLVKPCGIDDLGAMVGRGALYKVTRKGKGAAKRWEKETRPFDQWVDWRNF